MQDLIVRNGSTWSYTILGIPTEADAEQIKRACRYAIDEMAGDLEEGSRFTNGRVADLPERQEPRPVFPRFEEGGRK